MLPGVFLIKALKFLEFLQVLALDGMDLSWCLNQPASKDQTVGFYSMEKVYGTLGNWEILLTTHPIHQHTP